VTRSRSTPPGVRRPSRARAIPVITARRAVPGRAPVLTDPMRHPQEIPADLRTRRAAILLALTVLLPGAAQLVAGNRTLGRRALAVTLGLWAAAVVVVVLTVNDRQSLLALLTHRWWSLALTAVLIGLAVAWAGLFLNTLRIVRPPLLQRRARPVIAGALAVLVLATSGPLAYGAYLLTVSRTTFDSIFQAGPAFDPVDGRYNFLLMGGDAGENRVGRRPDSISVISVDADTGAAVTFSIPRNFQNAQFSKDSPLWKVYPDGYNCGDECILNSLYPVVSQQHAGLYPKAADPGAEAMMDAASGVLGIEVQAYVVVDMKGFSKLINAMGGIRVKAGGWVPISSPDIPGSYPPRHYPPKGWIPPGVQTLDGYHALWYARSREFVTDYDRISRQQCVQQAMIEQLDPATVLTRFRAIARAGTQIVETDIPMDQLGSFVDLALKAKAQKVRRLTIGPPHFGTPADNFVTYPDFSLIHQRVQKTLDASSTDRPKNSGKSGSGAGDDGAAAGGSAAAGTGPSEPARSEPAQTPDGGITEEYLQQLAVNADDQALAALLANNGKCSPA
jgi:LCP family protein required for cell wall assembly